MARARSVRHCQAGEVRAAEIGAASTKKLAKPKLIKRAIEKSQANHAAKSAKQKLQAAKEVFNKYKGFSEATVEGKIKRINNHAYTRKLLRELSELADEDLLEMVRASQDAAAFTKTAFNGSRNVNLWAMLGTFGAEGAARVGGATILGGIMGGPAGMAMGALMGGMVDRFGPRMTKSILNQVIKAKTINAKAIEKMTLPPEVKKELLKSFNSVVLGKVTSDRSEASAKRTLRGKRKWANEGFNRLQQETGDASKYADLMQTPSGRDALARLSALKPGSRAWKDAVKKLDNLRGAK